jgi:hypothetical protein
MWHALECQFEEIRKKLKVLVLLIIFKEKGEVAIWFRV